ncbi:hypothetical protein I551_4886 [Mycobacterium ulcerans str. Harvey]|uniref:Uncharacterized protein n=1 Tax=Mycobacterium ulcerans str. Harvey TaxID=1299332 RepID=A0ABP3AFT1_MYCUL|nr:hypothetical protein I551_4886 [Mycobacterium ulcerans str. Harvey]
MIRHGLRDTSRCERCAPGIFRRGVVESICSYRHGQLVVISA